MAAFLMGGSVAMAQDGPRGNKERNPKARAERMTEQMAKEYSLNAEQKQQLLEANLELAEKMRPKMSEEERAKMAEKKEQERKEHEAVRAEYDARLKKIMTAEQYAAYTKKMQEQKDKRHDKGGLKSDKKGK